MSKQGVRAGKQLKNAWAAKCGYLCYLLYNNYIVDQVLVALQKKKKISYEIVLVCSHAIKNTIFCALSQEKLVSFLLVLPLFV